MKITLEKIERAFEADTLTSFEELGCSNNFGDAYLYSYLAGNDVPNCSRYIREDEVADFANDCRKYGVTSFTISQVCDNFSRIVSLFAENGFRAKDIIEINALGDHYDIPGWRKRIPAILMEVKG